MKEKILVLGGNGFMGKNIQKAFENSDYEMFYESRRTNFDLSDYECSLRKLKEINPDIIIFAAAHVGSIKYVNENAANVVHDNSEMYLNLYKSVANFNKDITIINSISNCSYPGIIDIQHEDMWWDGPIHQSVESYGTPKKLGFIISECYKKQYDINTVNLIIPNAYGPNDYLDEEKTHAMNGIIMRMIKAQNNGDSEFIVWGTGSPIREWIYMPDMARFIKMIIDNRLLKNIPNTINIGQESGISIIDSVKKVSELLNFEGEIVQDTTKQDGAPIKILGKRLFEKTFTFDFTSYEEGIKETIKYYKGVL